MDRQCRQVMFDRQVEHFLARDAPLDEEPVHPFAGQGLEGGFQRLSRPRHDGLHLHAGAARGLADLRHVRLGEGISLVRDHADTARGGNKLADQFHTLAGYLRAPARVSGDIAARPVEAGDEARRDGIARACHHDRNVARRLLRRQRGWREGRDDEVDLEAHQLGGILQLEIGPPGS